MKELLISRSGIIDELKVCKMRLSKLKNLITQSGYNYSSDDYLTKAIEDIEKEITAWDDGID